MKQKIELTLEEFNRALTRAYNLGRQDLRNQISSLDFSDNVKRDMEEAKNYFTDQFHSIALTQE